MRNIKRIQILQTRRLCFLKRLTLENQMEAKTKEMHISKDDQVPPRSSQMCIAGPSQKPEMD